MYFRRKTADYFRSNFSSTQTLILRFGYLCRKTKECCFSYRALQLQTFGQGSLLGVHQITDIAVGHAGATKGILMIRTLSHFLFCFVLFLLLLVFLLFYKVVKIWLEKIVLQSTKGLNNQDWGLHWIKSTKAHELNRIWKIKRAIPYSVYRCIVNCRLVLAVLSGLQTSN